MSDWSQRWDPVGGVDLGAYARLAVALIHGADAPPNWPAIRDTWMARIREFDDVRARWLALYQAARVRGAGY